MKHSVLALSSLFLLGCASTNDDLVKHLPVKVIDAQQAEQCELLGTVSGMEEMSFTEERDMTLAYTNASQKAIDLGANSAVVKDLDMAESGNTVTVTMDAYLCK